MKNRQAGSGVEKGKFERQGVDLVLRNYQRGLGGSEIIADLVDQNMDGGCCRKRDKKWKTEAKERGTGLARSDHRGSFYPVG